VAKTQAQKQYLNSIKVNPLTFGVGSAGTGKTYVALAMAAQMLVSHDIERLVLVRPLVEAGEELGALPGELGDKLQPWVLPMMDILYERLGPTHTKYLLGNDRIRVSPLAYMRGSTFSNTFVMLTEAQNTSVTQMMMFLTRIGDGAKVVVDGDPRQSDVRGKNGLEDAIERLDDLRGVGMVEFVRQDIVRSGLCQDIVERYEG
jgi:phosphate starvation-inducible PhoH-like protein